MKVILLQNVKGLGKAGEIKEVAEGYGRNFLLGRKLAEIANDSSVRRVENIKKKQVEQEKLDLEKTQEIATKLEGVSVVLAVKEKNGKLFGSVHPKDIAKELKSQGFNIDQKSIILDEAIKEVGEYEARIELGHGIEVGLAVVVESAG